MQVLCRSLGTGLHPMPKTNHSASSVRRHSFRAQGRVGRLLPATQADFPMPGESLSDFRKRFLDYLSVNASAAEKALLDGDRFNSAGIVVSASALSSSRAERMLDAWLKGQRNGSDYKEQGKQSGSAAGAASRLPKPHEPAPDNFYEADIDYSEDDFDDDDDLDSEDFSYLPKVQFEWGERAPDWVRASERFASEPAAAPAQRGKSLSGSFQASNSQVTNAKERGERRETFDSGAALMKDSLGRVKEIHTKFGDRLEFSYDAAGHLISFLRLDHEGRVHSSAKRDRHGVIVRDGSGRVMAQGETLQVDPFGCVSIGRADGQYWSLDLVRSVHIEKRLLADEFGQWYAMTAIFCSDGFRMATRFSPVSRQPELDEMKSEAGEGRRGKLGHGHYRFYGRDGSVVEFGSDRDLEQMKPSGVMPPGSKEVTDKHWGRKQAGTAWASLREYMGNYLALGAV